MNKELSSLVNLNEYEKLNVGEKFVVDWQFGSLSHFKSALIELLCRADLDNLIKIQLSFPDEAIAVRDYKYTPGWWDELYERVTQPMVEK